MAECPVCLEEYSGEARQPKVLLCGHSACLPCLRLAPTCPECRQPYQGEAEGLPTNFALLDTAGGRVAEEWWCSECGAPAEEGCRREHATMPVQAALSRQARQLAPAAAEAAQGLGEAVRAAAAEPARAALQLLAEPNTSIAVRLRLAAQDGESVAVRCGLADAGAVGALSRALVCALAAEGRLQLHAGQLVPREVELVHEEQPHGNPGVHLEAQLGEVHEAQQEPQQGVVLEAHQEPQQGVVLEAQQEPQQGEVLEAHQDPQQGEVLEAQQEAQQGEAQQGEVHEAQQEALPGEVQGEQQALPQDAAQEDQHRAEVVGGPVEAPAHMEVDEAGAQGPAVVLLVQRQNGQQQMHVDPLQGQPGAPQDAQQGEAREEQQVVLVLGAQQEAQRQPHQEEDVQVLEVQPEQRQQPRAMQQLDRQLQDLQHQVQQLQQQQAQQQLQARQQQQQAQQQLQARQQQQAQQQLRAGQEALVRLVGLRLAARRNLQLQQQRQALRHFLPHAVPRARPAPYYRPGAFGLAGGLPGGRPGCHLAAERGPMGPANNWRGQQRGPGVPPARRVPHAAPNGNPAQPGFQPLHDLLGAPVVAPPVAPRPWLPPVGLGPLGAVQVLEVLPALPAAAAAGRGAVEQVLDVGDLSRSPPDERRDEKERLLARVRREGVRVLDRVFCSSDPAWTLELLRAAREAGRLRMLSLHNARTDHLLAVHDAPGLTHLQIKCEDAARAAPPLRLPLPEGWNGIGSLQLLSVSNVPHDVLRALLQANRATLEQLVLSVDLPADNHDLGAEVFDVVREFHLPRLRVIMLRRRNNGARPHCPVVCRDQRLELDFRRGQPANYAAVPVRCNICDPNHVAHFNVIA